MSLWQKRVISYNEENLTEYRFSGDQPPEASIYKLIV